MVPMEVYRSARYDPMDLSDIPGFMNHIPHIDWHTCLLNFIDEERDDAGLHLIKFHFHIHKLGVYFPGDYFMKMFISTLEEYMISWYERL